MKKLYLRLDDATQNRNTANWDKIEKILDKYEVKPLVGIIPDCKDPSIARWPYDDDFWDMCVVRWQDKGWTLAMHGYEHVFNTSEGGLNPVNNRSEFAGLSIDVQSDKIKKAVAIFRAHGIEPRVFFAPAHTFDRNTLKVLTEETNIKIICDTPANKPYFKYGMTFIPQQSGKVRRLPFDTITYCCHPNTMSGANLCELDEFLKDNKFSDFQTLPEIRARPFSFIDAAVKQLYFLRSR